MTVIIRAARPEEAARLTELCHRSKAHWGYDEAYMRLFRPLLQVTPESMQRQPTFVAELDRRVAGVAALGSNPPDGEVEMLFVSPDAIGKGVGAALWSCLVEEARARGIRRLKIESDPFAAGFYRSRGAALIGERPSPAMPGRMLPLFEYSIPA